MRKANNFPPRFKLYWMVYFGVLQDFMSAIFKHGLFPEASTDSPLANELAGALDNMAQKKLYLSNQRKEFKMPVRKYSRLFSECPPDFLAMLGVVYCVSMSKQLHNLSSKSVCEMFSNQYVGGKKRKPECIQVMNKEGKPEQMTDTSQLHLKDEFQFQSLLNHYAKQLEGDIQSPAHSSSLVNVKVAEEDDKDSPKEITKSSRKRKHSQEESDGE